MDDLFQRDMCLGVSGKLAARCNDQVSGTLLCFAYMTYLINPILLGGT